MPGGELAALIGRAKGDHADFVSRGQQVRQLAQNKARAVQRRQRRLGGADEHAHAARY
jgi:hypothetical protein